MKIVYDITKFTMLDYPKELACIVWFTGCNMRCKYCHNPQIVTSKGTQTLEDVKSFLETRVGVLGGVVLSGGEATLHKSLPQFARDIKEMGFKVKLDTNGTNPKMIQELIEEDLLDYVALDYKATKDKYEEITGFDKWIDFDRTLDILVKNQDKIEFEVRTTWHTSLLDDDDIDSILADLNTRGYNNTFFVQKCNPVEDEYSFAQLPASKNIEESRFVGKNDVKIR
ncbi:MAG: anaerobic ribonucleoside-triphosphate reductase activating protein [Proteobacteria bacterium]|nr:anaerobic ribonucleoside-triphosphate reductase activating protein [Pseudomonadota bacterium]